MIPAVLAVLWVVSLALTAWVTALLVRRGQHPLAPASSAEATAAFVAPVPEPVVAPAEAGPPVDLTPLARGLEFQGQCQDRLALAIVAKLRSTTDPLSQDLLAIRGDLVDLVGQVRSHDQALNSVQETQWLASQATVVSHDMDEASQMASAASRLTETNFRALRRALESVVEANKQITDLSERVNVLAINASIEAARAGIAGRGFKVIAGQVKTLAYETSSVVAQIDATLGESQALFARIDQDLGTRGAGVVRFLEKEKASFGEFRDRYLDQRGQFEDLCQKISAFAGRLDHQITRLSPVVQLHDITVQELENLAKVSRQGLEALVPPTDGRVDEALVKEWGLRVRESLTTAQELAVVDAVLADWGVATEALGPSAGPEFELF